MELAPFILALGHSLGSYPIVAGGIDAKVNFKFEKGKGLSKRDHGSFVRPTHGKLRTCVKDFLGLNRA
jgi:hypothetical protein